MKWYEIENIGEIDTPALLVYPDRIKSNIRSAINIVGNPGRLRPHIKTHKSKEAALLMIHAGISKFKCATIAEGELLGMANAPDVILAYQPVGPKIDRFIHLIQRFPATRYACLIDNIDAAKAIQEKALASHLEVDVFIDLDNGMHRSGIEPSDLALQLFQYAIGAKGLRVKGLHVYDGHIRDVDIVERKRKSDQAFELVMKFHATISKLVEYPLEIVCGGSPTFPIHALRPEVECSPGTFIYWDQGYSDVYHGESFLPAAIVVTRIISITTSDTITCDLGHKSIAAENDIRHRVYFLDHPELEPIGQSEEHLVLKVNSENLFKVGDVLYGIPHHICPTVALYEKVLTVEHQRVSGEWRNIARDRKITI
jgi:D-serine deaminase-like pyridoxal phosphate-dependent protein